jgi:Icc protein
MNSTQLGNNTTRHFALITDVHVVEHGESLYGLQTNRSASALVETLSKESVKLDGVVCLGDLADTVRDSNRLTAVATEDSYRNVQEIFSGLKMPRLALPGNHDHPDLLREMMPSSWHTFKDGVSRYKVHGVDLIGIDLRTGPEATGYLRDATLQELQRALADSEHALLLTHYPIVDFENEFIDKKLSTVNREKLLPVLRLHSDKIIGCFNGHLHITAQGYFDKIVATVVPSSSFDFVMPDSEDGKIRVGGAPQAYGLLSISPDGRVFYQNRFIRAAVDSTVGER